jgi:hypothetical protein
MNQPCALLRAFLRHRRATLARLRRGRKRRPRRK